jgi:DNA-binding NarL/FixJ family response regulator
VGIRVVLADDNLLVREGLQQVLSGQPEIEVVGSYADLPALLDGIETQQPDVVLTDIRMPPSMSDEGIRVAALLRESNPAVGVVVLSQFSEPNYALALLESGSDGRAYLLKERVHNRAQLVAALETVADGGSVIDTKVAQGRSNGAIADSLVLTKRAVEKHINSIFFKLDLSEEKDASKRVKAALAFLADEPEAAA